MFLILAVYDNDISTDRMTMHEEHDPSTSRKTLLRLKHQMSLILLGMTIEHKKAKGACHTEVEALRKEKQGGKAPQEEQEGEAPCEDGARARHIRRERGLHAARRGRVPHPFHLCFFF